MIILLVFFALLCLYCGYYILRFLYTKSEKKREIRILYGCILKEEKAGRSVPESTVQMLRKLEKEYKEIRLLKRQSERSSSIYK